MTTVEALLTERIETSVNRDENAATVNTEIRSRRRTFLISILKNPKAGTATRAATSQAHIIITVAEKVTIRREIYISTLLLPTITLFLIVPSLLCVKRSDNHEPESINARSAEKNIEKFVFPKTGKIR